MPITIGSSPQRLSHRIIANRLKQDTKLNSNQRGFVEADGVLTNCLLLNTFIKSKRRQVKPHVVVALDIQKALDRVSHNCIKRALTRFGIDEMTANYIMEDLRGSSIRISLGKLTTEPITIKRGVKQGDPLSPILFNLVIDELVDNLHRGEFRGTIGSEEFNCPVLAFADDLVLLCDMEDEAQLQINIAESFLKARGMFLSPKSVAV